MALCLASGCHHRGAEDGRRLFDGERLLSAHLEGDDQPLPVEASRCANCHLPHRPEDADARSTQLFGPSVDTWALRELRARRGGPPSRYDVASFCALLRTGQDPAHMLVARAMPRYAIDDDSCRALWAHVTR